MKNKNYNKILSIIDDLELTNKLIDDLKALNNGTTKNILGVSSILRKKRNLTKKLLSEMIAADISFSHFEKIYQVIFSSLKDGEKKDGFTEKAEKVVALAEKVLVPVSR